MIRKDSFWPMNWRCGKEYFLIVTTPEDIYRNNTDDIIVVTGFFNKTPYYRVVQKGLNRGLFDGPAKLYESQVNEAVNRAIG